MFFDELMEVRGTASYDHQRLVIRMGVLGLDRSNICYPEKGR